MAYLDIFRDGQVLTVPLSSISGPKCSSTNLAWETFA
jgi:hypothetical protein